MAKQGLEKAVKQLNAAIAVMREHGISCWGFMFTDFGTDETKLECFNNNTDPIPVFIIKTEEALKVIRTLPVEGKPVEELEQEFAEVHAQALSKQKKVSLN